MTGIVVKSQIKKYVEDLNIAGDVGEALDAKVIEILKKAEERAKANQRKTLYARDL